MKHIFFSVGEPSGDIHAAAVIRQLAGFRVTGIAGDAMMAAGVTPLLHIRETAVMGFYEVARNYFRLKALFRKTCEAVAKDRPDLLVLVDYPGFNLKLARFAKTLNIPVLYYIAPKVWAWGSWRNRTLRRGVDRMAVIFPFEEDYFRSRGIRADYVGNPNVEVPHTEITRDEFLRSHQLPEKTRVLGLLPGSRNQEVERILPVMVGAARTLLDTGLFDAACISRAGNIRPGLFAGAEADPRIRFVDGSAGPIFAHSDFLFVKSGTATLEAALHLKPFLITYKVSALSTFIGKRLVGLRSVSMINIILGHAAVPEVILDNAIPENLATETRALLSDIPRKSAMIAEFQTLKEDLSRKKASLATASIIKEMTHG